MRREDGRVAVMTMGFFVVIGLLVVVVVNASAAFLQRQQLSNLADGAALAAADGLSRDLFYRQGAGESVVLDPAQARRLVSSYLADDDVTRWTVATNGDRVTVRLERMVDLALAPPGWGDGTTIISEATSQLRLGE